MCLGLCIAASLVCGCSNREVTNTDQELLAVSGTITAGPIAPPTRDNPTPGSEPFEGAQILVFDQFGRQVGSVDSDARGRFVIELPPGTYRFEPQPVDGLMGTASEQMVTIPDSDRAGLSFDYDTGIR